MLRFFLFFFLYWLPGACLPAQETEIQYLSGTGMDDKVNWVFRIDRGMNSGEWTQIPVPSNWELEGFGVYNYGRGDNPPSDETGEYQYRFEVPAAWESKTVYIVFEGVMTDAAVAVNGQPAGPVHQGGFYRFRHDISGLLDFEGENLLEVTVRNWSANESVNAAERRADYWIFGGIYRPVYLEAKPRQHIDRTAINAPADGQFTIDVYLHQIEDATAVEAQLADLDGTPLGDPFSLPVEPGAEQVVLATALAGALPWSPEFPHRYRVVVRLLRDTEVLHQITETFGFRTVDLRPGDGIYVNNVKVRFKGVNRHSFWPESGRTTNRALSIRDVELIKDMNMNAVRMSHYPPDRHFLEVCDSLGLFVLDELAGWQDAYDTAAGKELVRELVTRDVNHPSIVIWANGNEGGFNPGLDDDFHRYDPQRRPVIHPWTTFRHTDTQHYLSYDCCTGTGFHSPEVFFPTELLHGLYDGGHGAGLEDYWNLMRQHSNNAGAFLWVFADEGVLRTDQNGRIDTWGNHAPDGILGPFREKEGSYYSIKEIWSPVQIEAPPGLNYFYGRLRIQNRYHYTSLDQCAFTWALLDFSGPLEAPATTVADSGRIEAPPVAPGEAGWLLLDLPEDWYTHQALQIRIEDPHGREVFTYRFPLHQPGQVAERFIVPGQAPAELSEDENFFFLAGGPTRIHIDRRTGMLAAMEHDGRAFSLSGGPRLDLSMGLFRLDSITPRTDAAGASSLQVHFGGVEQNERPGTDWSLRYTMLPGGWLRIDYEYLPRQGDYDYLGVNFDYPEDKVRGVRWLGRGPYRVWKNRMKGPQFGLWEKAYNNTVTGESGWEYPEFKGYHADLYWAELLTEEGRLAIVSATPGLFLRLYTPPPPQGAANDHTSGAFPGGDLSIMHAISPIGTKFKPAGQLGPMSQPNPLYYNRDRAPLRGTLFLNFGE